LIQRIRRRGFTLIELMITVAILSILAVVLTGVGINGCRSATSRYQVVGTVVKAPKGKLRVGGEAGGAEKWSVPMLSRGGTGDCAKRISNCDATGCASLEIGDVAVFSCYDEFHFFEPNEEECRYDGLASEAKFVGKLEVEPCPLPSSKGEVGPSPDSGVGKE
jgi:prepilin-type N-terminal cleavage/methylation domain-containing protein